MIRNTTTETKLYIMYTSELAIISFRGSAAKPNWGNNFKAKVNNPPCVRLFENLTNLLRYLQAVTPKCVPDKYKLTLKSVSAKVHYGFRVSLEV